MARAPPLKSQQKNGLHTIIIIAPGQLYTTRPKSTRNTSHQVSTNQKKMSPEDYANERAKYAQFFIGNRILPIPELVEAVQPKIISFIVTDLKTRRLAGIKKETLEEQLKAAGIPARYFCRRSFTTWDVLLLSEDLAKKLAGSNITSKYYRLQLEYKGHRKIRVTMCNVPIQLNGDVLAAYLSE